MKGRTKAAFDAFHRFLQMKIILFILTRNFEFGMNFFVLYKISIGVFLDCEWNVKNAIS